MRKIKIPKDEASEERCDFPRRFISLVDFVSWSQSRKVDGDSVDGNPAPNNSHKSSPGAVTTPFTLFHPCLHTDIRHAALKTGASTCRCTRGRAFRPFRGPLTRVLNGGFPTILDPPSGHYPGERYRETTHTRTGGGCSLTETFFTHRDRDFDFLRPGVLCSVNGALGRRRLQLIQRNVFGNWRRKFDTRRSRSCSSEYAAFEAKLQRWTEEESLKFISFVRSIGKSVFYTSVLRAEWCWVVRFLLEVYSSRRSLSCENESGIIRASVRAIQRKSAESRKNFCIRF